MCKWIFSLLVGLAALPATPVYAQSTEGDTSGGTLLLVAALLVVIIVGSALVIRRFQFARQAQAERPMPRPSAPKAAAPEPKTKAPARLSVADEDAAYEVQLAEQRESDRLSVALEDTRQSLAFIAEKLQSREAEVSAEADLLNIAKHQHDVAFQEIQATRGLLDFHKHSLSHMGEDDTHRRMELQDAIREASLAVIQTDKAQAEREERIRHHQSRIADLKQECDFLGEEQNRLAYEARTLEQRLSQLQPRRAA